MSAQDDLVRDQLALLQHMQMPGMGAEERQEWLNRITDIENQYRSARRIEEDKDSSAAQKKYAKELGESIAKGLPEITKGLQSAITSFQKGDAITGSAAIMDIISAAAPIMGAMLGATGPEGMLVGALFSVIGQILAFFAPKQPSLKDEIQEMLQALNTEKELQHMEAVRLSIEERDIRLTNIYHELTRGDPTAKPPVPPILKLPLLTESDADEFEKRMTALNVGIMRAQQKSDHPSFINWDVAAWLKMTEKQVYSRWSEVLGTWCRVYIDLVSSNIKFNCLINPQTVQELVRYTHEKDGECPLPPLTKATVHGLLTDLQGLALDLVGESAASNAVALEVLKAVTPAAQGWGLFACLGTNHSLYFTSGRTNFANWTDRSDSNYYHRLAIIPAEAAGSGTAQCDLKPRYHCLILKSDSSEYPGSHNWLDHLWVHSDTFNLDDTRRIRDNPVFFDISAAEKDGRLDCWAVPGGKDGVEGWSLDKTNQFQPRPGGWNAINKPPAENVRALYPMMASVLPDDPDADAIPRGSAWLDPEQPAYAALIYAGLRSAPEIYVNGLNAGHYVPSPWPTYTGIAVDKHYLWVFQPYGFACATHASVISCILSKRTTPRWIQYSLPVKMQGRFTTNVRGEPIGPDDPQAPPMDGVSGRDNYWSVDGRQPERPMPALKGLISMSPCEDGTILASVVYREAQTDDTAPVTWYATDRNPRLYTTGYTIDLEAGAIHVDEPWTQFVGPHGPTTALQVQKMPIPCWSLLSSLKERLEIH